jgi:tight adherence protein B
MSAAALIRGVLLALTLLFAVSSPATAAEQASASVAHVEPTEDGVQILVSVPEGTEVDLDGVTATIDGENASAEAALATSTTDVRRTAVLAIDVSNSMAGERFEAAQNAAMTFLDTVPDDVYVGIVTFASDVEAAVVPTQDRDEAREVIEELQLSPQTHLYDGVLAAVDMAGAEGQRSVLVLSDGADTSGTPLKSATQAVTDADVLLDVVALEQEGAAKAALEDLADAAEGRVIDADPDALREAFTEEADALARQVLVTAELPESVTGDEATVSVSLPTGDATLVADAFAAIRGTAPAASSSPSTDPSPATAERGLMIPETWMYAGLAGVGLGLLLLLYMLVPRPAVPLTAGEVASTYTQRSGGRFSAAAPKVEPDQALTQAKDAATKVLQRNVGLEAKIAARLEGAGNPLKPAEWLLVHAAIFIGAGVVGLLFGQGSLVVGLLFMIGGFLGPWIYLGFKRGRRRKAFNAGLPDTLQLMSGSLSAGLSLAQSVDTVVREGTEPISSEFKRVLIETRLGVGLEEALEGVADRFDSKDFGWVVMAINIQRQVGGNLAELLDTVAGTIREREYMRRQVAALAAEGKLSAWVLGGLPPIFLVYLLLTNREYVMPMFTEPLGWLMLGGAGCILGVGIFWMSRLVKVEV